ncbi:MAG: 30S ribosome-binding factor RbfA [Gammaproteobacteria bacterium]|jgi:ribosome-binding factor A
MPRDYPRSERLGSQIQRELARLLRTGLKDPRLGMPSILDVEVSKDLAHARVFFSLLDPENAADCLEALNHASGFLQREIGKQLKARVTPKLSFVYDDTDIRGRQLSDLIDSAVASDKQKSGG